MGIIKNEHDDEVDEDWEPGNDMLKGASPGQLLAAPPEPEKPDELPHRKRVEMGLDSSDPDPGYNPDDDDLDEPL